MPRKGKRSQALKRRWRKIKGIGCEAEDQPTSTQSMDLKAEALEEVLSISAGHNLHEDQQKEEEEFQKKIIKEEEADDEDYLYGRTSSSVVQLNEEAEDYLYCELCKSFFIKNCELHGPALFIPDTPVPMGVPDRARKTLPPGLEVQKSGIPDAGLGVFNKGQTVPVGAHFGPYQGDVVEREEAMNSGYSWVIYRSRKCEEYIDAKRETNANWMRYVNCARTDEEQNLVAFQYGGGILYRSCRPIEPGQELLVSYKEEYAKDLSVTFSYLWNRKCSVNGINNALLADFPCSTCPVSYTYQICHLKSENPPPTIIFSDLEMSTGPQCNKYHEQMHCSDCGKSLTQQSNLQLNQSANEEGKTYHCSQTGMSFVSGCNDQQPHHDKPGEKPYQCSQCGKSFAHQTSLQQHQRIHTGEKPYQCSQCGKSFAHKTSLQQHQRIHTGEKPYHCTQCGKRFAYLTSLQQHQRIHTGERPYHCTQCGKRFAQPTTLQQHQRIHTGERPYHCSQCGKSFAYKTSLQQHQHIHTGEKPFICSRCGKSFNRKCRLQVHQHNHTGNKPYYCSHCGKCYAQKNSLQRHQRIHSGDKLFQCLKCRKYCT